jgi:hypothetical protein
MTAPDTAPMILDCARLKKSLDAAPETDMYTAIVNGPFDHKVETAFLFLGIIVLTIANPKTGNIDRVALSATELAKNTTDVSLVPFDKIKIPVDHSENIIARAIQTGQPQDTTDWKYLFEPALTPEQARINQASGGIAYSAVYPLAIPGGGALIFSYYQYSHDIGERQRDFMERYAKIVSDWLTKA